MLSGKRLCSAILLLWAAWAGFAADPAFRIGPLDEAGRDWVEKTLAKMSLEEKVGQLLIPSFSARSIRPGSKSFPAFLESVRRFRPGGLHLSAGNLRDIVPTLNRLQKASPLPLLITADLEGGTGFRFPGATRIPRAMAIGAGGDPEQARQAGLITAREARPLGIHVDFYPVADVNNNPHNPIINIRSFGEDPEAVKEMVCSYVRGLQENGMIAVVKHFPGHGNTSTDSHLELPVIRSTREELQKVELTPFRAAMEAGVIGVMAGHLEVPALEPQKGLPATLSAAILTGLLRQEIGFRGLVFTDALSMGGLADVSLPRELFTRAFLAGADMLLAPQKTVHAYQDLLESARQGRIPADRLNASVRRILEAKARLGLARNPPADPAFAAALPTKKSHQAQAQQMMENAITLVKDERHSLPLRLARSARILHLRLLDTMNWRPRPGALFARELLKRQVNTRVMELGKQAAPLAFRKAEQAVKTSDAILVSVFIRVTSSKGSVELSPEQIGLLKNLSAGKKPFVLVVFGSPYLLNAVPELPCYMAAFEYYPEAEKIAAKAVFGEIPLRGRLPVSLGEKYPVGTGIRRP